jgi:hypothetical protein
MVLLVVVAIVLVGVTVFVGMDDNETTEDDNNGGDSSAETIITQTPAPSPTLPAPPPDVQPIQAGLQQQNIAYDETSLLVWDDETYAAGVRGFQFQDAQGFPCVGAYVIPNSAVYTTCAASSSPDALAGQWVLELEGTPYAIVAGRVVIDHPVSIQSAALTFGPETEITPVVDGHFLTVRPGATRADQLVIPDEQGYLVAQLRLIN